MQAEMAEVRRVVGAGSLPAPRFGYTPVVQVGAHVFVSGLVGLDPDSGVLAATAAAQVGQILRNLSSLCKSEGWSLDRLVVARIYCAQDADVREVNAAWDHFFKGNLPPARSFVVVAALPLGAAVEIEFQLVV